MKRMMIFLILVFVATSAWAQTPGTDWLKLTSLQRGDAVVYLVSGWLAADWNGGHEKVNEATYIAEIIKAMPPGFSTGRIANAITLFYSIKGNDANGIAFVFAVVFRMVMEPYWQPIRRFRNKRRGLK